MKRDENAKSCETRLREREGGARDLDGRTSRRHTTYILLEISKSTAESVVEMKSCEIAKLRKRTREGRNNSARNALKFGSDRREYATEYYCRFNKLRKEVDPSQSNQSTRSLSKHFSHALSTTSNASAASLEYSRVV